MKGLRIDTSHHIEPNTRFTKSELEALADEIDKADRKHMETILEKIMDHQINEYHKRELNGLLGMVQSEKFKLQEIKSTTKGILLKITPASGGAKGASTFHFRSTQIHGFMANGHRKTRKNVVVVNGNTGHKKVEIYDSKRKGKTYKNTKRLSKKEITYIRRGKLTGTW